MNMINNLNDLWRILDLELVLMYVLPLSWRSGEFFCSSFFACKLCLVAKVSALFADFEKLIIIEGYFFPEVRIEDCFLILNKLSSFCKRKKTNKKRMPYKIFPNFWKYYVVRPNTMSLLFFLFILHIHFTKRYSDLIIYIIINS